jgi:hypothetical protein
VTYTEVSKKAPAPKLTEKEMEQLLSKATRAGLLAGEAVRPKPMVVYEADVLTGEKIGKEWLVEEGVCGFAWVQVFPGGSRFANFLKRKGVATSDSYEGGVKIWVGVFGQSYERKRAYASAMAEVFRQAGIRAYSGSRLD